VVCGTLHRSAREAGVVNQTNKREQLQQVMAVFQHPTRRRLLKLTVEQGCFSVREGARYVREPLGNVRYHLQVLTDSGAVEVVCEQTVRGSLTKFWGATALIGETQWIKEALEATA
jgi:predicted transcriptional regulator